MTTREYRIGPEFALPVVLSKARKLAARAEAKGLSGGYTLTFEERTENGPFGERTLVRYLVIEGEPVRLNGWTFVAAVEYVNNLPVVNGSPWYEGPQVDRDALKPGYCDYCQTVRRRGKTIVVENEAGERRQVGTSCVKDFLGATVTGAWYDDKDPFRDLGGYGGSGGITLYPVEMLLTAAAMVIRQAGFVPASAYTGVATRSSVSTYLWGTGKAGAEARAEFGTPTTDDEDTAQRALAFGRAMEGDSDYAMNVRAVFASDGVEAKRLGLVVSVVGVMLKQEGLLREREAAPVVTEEVFAEPKAKIELADATVTDVRVFDSGYGPTEVFTFVAEGYRFEWMTSSRPDLNKGDRVSLKATVKGRNEYRGRVSTTLIRVKAEPVKELAA